jgi:hypothetical protein
VRKNSDKERDAHFSRLAGEELFWRASAEGLSFGATVLLDVARAAMKAVDPLSGTRPAGSKGITVRERLTIATRMSDSALRIGQKRTAALLYGLAAENLLKGLRVRHLRTIGRSHVKSERGRLRVDLGGHDLPQIAREAAIVLSRDEMKVLKELAIAVTWAGRYPVRKRSTDDSGRDLDVRRGAALVEKLFSMFTEGS